MNWLRGLGRRLSMLLHWRQFDTDLEEEMRPHLELRGEQQAESGVETSDARAATRRRFGNPTVLREKSRSAWGWEWLEDFFQNVSYGLRGMARSAGITAVELLSLAQNRREHGDLQPDGRGSAEIAAGERTVATGAVRQRSG
jgi:hypothetical protein